MSVDAARIKAVGRSVIMTLMKSNTEHAAVHKLHTCIPTQQSTCPALHLPPPAASVSARLHGAHGPRPHHSPLPTLCHLSGCTFRFNFVAIMHAKVQCFVGILFTLHPAPCTCPHPCSCPCPCPLPCSLAFYCVFHRDASSVPLTHTHSLPCTQ